ncbi:MAG: NUDIX hydrolase [Porticoccaceae bacterium]|jgi:8-oxo-dGTP pyrophosphatase MutT (NUDIX family)|nr:NUDIX hydrolase [Porticoccaceae bacterium]MDB9733166.1 NUDIX hydrolase [Porticoccaceae bacterium]
MTDSSIPIRLAGTAVLLRDSAEGLETLLLRRNAKLAFAGGAWVFPGGAIDASELEAASTEEQAARTATVREVHEECGLTIAENSLVHFCNWTTPIGEKRRFATWFFAAQADQDSEDVLIDGSEIHEFQWLSLRKSIELYHLGELILMPPTYLAISLISHYESAKSACDMLAARQSFEVTPRLCKLDGQMVCLYPGDAGYELNDPVISGARHRTLFTPNGMEYAHSGDDVGVVPMDKP